ncbi:Rha family transcriptional regulator [Ligilactobacillus salivarius]|uniref:Rha family transcriptional regulator n=1 Tax=Ligilactobacillus salivarius TaxID=1624 RepID=UPI00236290E4|nr:Rha family transcriptional regulator [Ligilactobacillus salivarius]MDD1403588.1 Rha family transcriptional regulator [Ligilactobacillus salivarius]
MNDLVIMHNKQAVTTSLVLAETFGKEHKDVIRAIETKIRELKIEQSSKMFF